MAVDAKPKRRNSEKRKEKSRDAARSRRGKETEIFRQLGNQLPISQNTLALLDKSSIVRLGNTHLKLRQLFSNVVFAKPERMLSLPPLSSSSHPKVDHLFCRALDGFLMLVNKDGALVFVTDNVSSHLGLSQVDLLGLNIYDFIHPCDHNEMQDVLSGRSIEAKNLSQSLFIRMKCTLTSKGHSINIKSAYYKVIHCLPSTVSTEQQQQVEPQNLSKSGDRLMSFTLLLCRSLFPSSTSDVLLDSRTFVSHHNMDMSFIYCDERFGSLLGYKATELLGKSLYNFHHVLDDDAVEKSYKTLFSKGQCVTGLYRFLSNGGGYVWMETRSSIIIDPRSEKEQFVVCIHFVVSEVECHDQVFSSVQQGSCSLESSEDLPDTLEADEIDIDDDDEEDEEEEEAGEVDSDAIFMTEQILKFAGQDFSFPANRRYREGSCALSSTSSLSSDKYLLSHRPAAIDSTVTDYRQLAPYISVEDTEFGAMPFMTTDTEIAAVDSAVMDPDLDQGLATRSENPILMSFRDMTYSGNKPSVSKPLHWFSHAAQDAASIPSSGFRTRQAEFPLEESGEFNSVGDSESYSAHRLVQQDVACMLTGSSVLKNLLVKGEDTNYGYRLLETPAVLTLCR